MFGNLFNFHSIHIQCGLGDFLYPQYEDIIDELKDDKLMKVKVKD